MAAKAPTQESAGLLQPIIVVNGFPKAGTHLALSLVAALAKPWQADGDDNIYYFGTFKHHSWSDQWTDRRGVTWAALNQPPGTWLRGHLGYFPQLEEAFTMTGTCLVFIYRDLRDVAVSMLYHIEDTERDWKHSERDLYMALPDREARLVAIIEGIGRDPGLIRRWELYSPWLACSWAHSIRFEDVIADKEAAIHDALQYCIGRTAAHHGMVAGIPRTQYDAMVGRTLYALDHPEQYSKTYRKGRAGGWRDEFTPAVTAAFDTAGGNEWLDRLGYDT